MKYAMWASIALVCVAAGWYVLGMTSAQKEGRHYEQVRFKEGGLSFSYLRTPHGYVPLPVPLEAWQGHMPAFSLTLIEEQEADALAQRTAPREGPPHLRVLAFATEENLSTWVSSHAAELNLPLLQGALASTTLGGLPATRFLTDGLYRTETIVAVREGYAFVLSGSFDAPDDAIRTDFLALLASLAWGEY